MQEAKNYYESLYTSFTNKETSNEYDDIFFPENIEAKLTDDQKLSCEGELSAAECFESLKTMDSFASISGLRINYEKTEALWIGAMRFQKGK